MQLLRYMICIWTEYRREKEAEREECRLQCVQKVKERRMGYLFENMEKMSLREERRNTEAERKRADREHERAEEANRKAEEEHRKAEEAIKRADEAEEKLRLVEEKLKSLSEKYRSKEPLNFPVRVD